MSGKPISLQQLLAIASTGNPGAWLSRLANSLEMNAADVLLRSAELLAYPTMSPSQVDTLLLDFAVADYATMIRWIAIIAPDDSGAPVAVLGAPLIPGLGAWLASLRVEQVFLADPSVVLRKLESHEALFSAVADAVGEPAGSGSEQSAADELTFMSIQGELSPAVKLVNSTVFDALRLEASDIHLETVPQGLLIKFRIDGVLNRIATVNNPSLAEHAIARVKVLAELDIGEKRVPQDGRFRVAAKGREIDIRVSIMPSIFGEDAVLRILDKQAVMDDIQSLTLDALGFDAQTIQLLRRLATEPYGMMLVTGPTGSGKTTTLYAALTEINSGEDKIITIEDPVEYQLPGVLQIPVNERKGLTFAVGLRSILRHDPDKILVGEIRDPETAQIAVQSALTGHMVFTSVHANNTFDVIGRFIHMGVDPYNFVSSLTGVVAQRLVRQNCPHCSVEVTPEGRLLEESGVTDVTTFRFMAGRGCVQCRSTGFKGRRAVAEVLRLTDEIREMIVARAPIRAMKEQARLQGTRFLRDVALDLVRDGKTTLQEVNRVTFVA